MDTINIVPVRISDRFPADYRSHEFQSPERNISWLKRIKLDGSYQSFVRAGKNQGRQIIVMGVFPNEKEVGDDWVASYVISCCNNTFPFCTMHRLFHRNRKTYRVAYIYLDRSPLSVKTLTPSSGLLPIVVLSVSQLSGQALATRTYGKVGGVPPVVQYH